MTETSRNAQSADFDLSQFFQVFFEEASENLQTMEQMLLALDVEAADDETLNAIFRCAHSVKGGAATFGFSDVAELTHQMETLLDKLRRHELAPRPQMVDLLLAAGDSLRSLLARHQGSDEAAPETSGLLRDIRALCAGGAGTATQAPPPANELTPASATPRLLELTVGELVDDSLADSLVELFNEIADLGQIEALDAGCAADGMRRFKLTTTSSDSDLLDLFTFHVPREALRLAPLGPGYGFHEGAPGAPPAEPSGYGFFDDAIIQAKYYISGIFKGEGHPFEKLPTSRMNPIQKMTYFMILNVLLPLQIITGALMWSVQKWPEFANALGGLQFLAPFHSLVAWMFGTFILVHVYMTTTGATPLEAMRAMVTGYEEVEVHKSKDEG